MNFIMDFLFLLVVNILVDTVLWYPGASMVRLVSGGRLKSGERRVEKGRADDIVRINLFFYTLDGQRNIRSHYVASIGLVLVLGLALVAYGLSTSMLSE